MNSPTVQIQTIDKSYYQPGFTNEVAAYVGYFEKGPINEPVFITDINQFKFIFGRGVDLFHNDWYQVYNYLQYASGIWVVRASGNKQWNANNGDSIYVNSKEEFEALYNDLDTVNGIRVIAKTPGESGNLISVAFFGYYAYGQNLEIGFGQTARSLTNNMLENESLLVVFRNGKVVEKYTFNEFDTKDTLMNISKYVYIKRDHIENPYQNYFASNLIHLENGSTNFATDDDFRTAHDILKNKDSYYLDIIIGNQLANELAIDVAESRKDCLAFIGMPTRYIEFLKINGDNGSEVLYTEDGLIIVFGDFITPKNLDSEDSRRLYEYVDGLPQSEFVHFTANVKSQMDGFSGKPKLVNMAADAAGLKSKASLISPWTPGAGLEKGIILNGETIHVNIDTNGKKRLYQRGLNFVEGGILMSQKTFTSKPSAFDRVHTRSLFNHIEKTVERILRKFVFEENREGVRRTIALEVKNILNDVRVNRGIEAGKVVVHPAGDNPSAITVDVYVKPTYVAEFIQLRMNNVGSNTISSILSNTLG